MTGLIVPHYRLSPMDFVALIDEREKLPLSLAPLRTETARLVTGDYAPKGLERSVAVERKSLFDLVHGFRCRRHQVESQVTRLLALPTRLMVIETTPGEIDLGDWPHSDEISPQFVREMITRWELRGLQVELTGSHERTSDCVVQFLRAAASEYFEKYGPFFDVLGCGFVPRAA